MELPNAKDLKAILKVCREFSVETVEVGTLKIKFSDVSPIHTEAATSAAQLSDEDMVYWSSQPDPLAERMDKTQ
jgi:hypothetical protein